MLIDCLLNFSSYFMYIPPVETPNQVATDPSFVAVRPWWVVSIGALILYVIPDFSQAGWPMADMVVDHIASFIPSISRWEELSPWPGNTKLFALFIWMMIPAQFYWLISSRALAKYVPEVKSGISPAPLWRRVVALFQIALLVLMFFVLPYFFAIVDSEPCRFCVNTDRLAQLALGSAFSLTASGWAAYLYLLVEAFFKSRIKREG